MPYTITEEKTYPHAKDVLLKAILGAIEGLEGKVAQNDQENGYIVVKFPKTILGNVLGDRTQMELKMSNSVPNETQLSLTIYPITRFLLEMIRNDESGMPGVGLTSAQLVSLILLVGAAALWAYLSRRPPGRAAIDASVGQPNMGTAQG